MIVDDDLDEATIQDALRILNDLQTNLSVPYKQRKNLAPTPTEKQSRRMLKDIHVLEVQCLEVAAIAYHFGKKCKVFRDEVDRLKDSAATVCRTVDIPDSSALASIECLLQGEHEATQRVEATLSNLKDVVLKTKVSSESRAEEVKRQVTQGFRDLERQLEALRTDKGSIGELSVRTSLTAGGNEKEERQLTVEGSESTEILGVRRLRTHRQTQTVGPSSESPPAAAPQAVQDTTVFSIPAKRESLGKKQSLVLQALPPLSIAPRSPPSSQQLTEAYALSSEVPLQLQTSFRSIETVVPTRLDFVSYEIAEVFPAEKTRELWRLPDLEVIPEPVKTQALQDPFSDEEQVDGETQTEAALAVESVPAILIPGEEPPELTLEASNAYGIPPTPKLFDLRVEVQHALAIPSEERPPHLEVCPCAPVAIRSWSLLDVFTFTEEAAKEEEGDPSAKKRSRRRVVRKDPIEEFFMLVTLTQTLQAAKLNQPQRESVPRIDGEALYRRAIQEGVPFNRWNEWLQQVLRLSGTSAAR